MKRFNILTLVTLLSFGSAWVGLPTDAASATESKNLDETTEIVVEPHQVIVQVNGIVCSFCAYGAEKGLSKLNGLDESQFGNGVLIDIGNHRLTIFFEPETHIPFTNIYKTIKKAGYDPITFHVRVSGKIEEREDALVLTNMSNGQEFALTGSALKDILVGESADLQAHVDAKKFTGLTATVPVEIIVDTLHPGEGKTDENE